MTTTNNPAKRAAELFRQALDLLLLAEVDRMEAPQLLVAVLALHLTEHQRLAVQRHDVQLPQLADVQVALEDLHPLGLHQARGELLAQPAEVLRSHQARSRGSDTRNTRSRITLTVSQNGQVIVSPTPRDPSAICRWQRQHCTLGMTSLPSMLLSSMV